MYLLISDEGGSTQKQDQSIASLLIAKENYEELLIAVEDFFFRARN